MEILSRAPLQKIADGIACRIEPGEKDKILWLHGYTLDSSSWGEMWSLLPGWHHIGIDLPGHGASDPIQDRSNLKELGVKLGGICLKNDIRHLVALSFGTIVAIQLALELPAFFSSIVLGAPAIAGGPQDPEMTQVYSRIISLYQQEGLSPKLRSIWMESRAWRGIEKHPGLAEALTSLVASHTWAELQSYTRMMQFTYPPQKIDDLEHIRAAMMILVGEQEMPAFRKCADILKQKVPHCELHELPETDHLCMLQSPQLSAELIRHHLEHYSTGREQG